MARWARAVDELVENGYARFEYKRAGTGNLARFLNGGKPCVDVRIDGHSFLADEAGGLDEAWPTKLARPPLCHRHARGPRRRRFRQLCNRP